MLDARRGFATNPLMNDIISPQSGPPPLAMPSTSTESKPPLKFGIANFKAFGPQMQSFSLRPLTLIFGPNSAGKSSLIHSLLWAKDVLTTSDPDVRKVSAAHGQVDLGGFGQIRFQGKTDRDVSLRVSWPWETESSASHDLDVTLRYGTDPTPPNFWSAAAHMVPNAVQEARQEGLSDMEVAAKLVLQFHAPFARTRLLQSHPSIKTSSFRGTRGDMFMSRLVRRVCLTIVRVWKSHPDLAKSLSIEGPDEYLDRLAALDFRELVPTLEEIGATLDKIEAEILAFWFLASLQWLPDDPAVKMQTSPRLVEVVIEKDGRRLLGAKRMDDDQFWLTAIDSSLLVGGPLQRFLNHAHKFFRLTVQNGRPTGLSFDTETYTLFRKAFGISPMDESATSNLESMTSSLSGLFTSHSNKCDEAFKCFEYVGPLRHLPSRHESMAGIVSSKNMKPANPWQRLLADQQLRLRVNDWLGKNGLDLGYEILIDHLVELSQVQKLLEHHLHEEFQRIEQDAESEPNCIGMFVTPQLDPLGNEADPDVADLARGKIEMSDERLRGKIKRYTGGPREFEDHDDFLGVLDERGTIQRTSGNLELCLATVSNAMIRLRDIKSGAKVSLQDIGVGISQILPLILRCVADESSLIAIEQPEIHVHPALQAELGDLFIESALKKENTLILETHSEHLILRIMRRMRETFDGKLPEGKLPVTPNDVCILYVEPGENGSIVREMPLNERGELIKGWPGGFFEEALNEMF